MVYHEVSSNGLAYGFAYDDVCAQSTTMQFSLASAGITMTLGKFFS
ncbi:MAG TPA: beta-1,3-glucanase family protein [Candidatus Dormibacteraeota bacterium]|nr:beta-1,3-glucanase family protein [Candidatus Dormibacteraeota bacterium]